MATVHGPDADDEEAAWRLAVGLSVGTTAVASVLAHSLIYWHQRVVNARRQTAARLTHVCKQRPDGSEDSRDIKYEASSGDGRKSSCDFHDVILSGPCVDGRHATETCRAQTVLVKAHEAKQRFRRTFNIVADFVGIACALSGFFSAIYILWFVGNAPPGPAVGLAIVGQSIRLLSLDPALPRRLRKTVAQIITIIIPGVGSITLGLGVFFLICPPLLAIDRGPFGGGGDLEPRLINERMHEARPVARALCLVFFSTSCSIWLKVAPPGPG